KAILSKADDTSKVVVIILSSAFLCDRPVTCSTAVMVLLCAQYPWAHAGGCPRQQDMRAMGLQAFGPSRPLFLEQRIQQRFDALFVPARVFDCIFYVFVENVVPSAGFPCGQFAQRLLDFQVGYSSSQVI
ncbi:hypothetical protein FOL47_005581, partial [Perkinsus chesapeaki]